MLRYLILPAALLLPFAAIAQQPPPKPAEIVKLVAQLGSEDFAEREAATKRLEELGTTAIEELRAGLRSDNPETVRRALDLLRKAERQIASEKTLAPTLVELDVKEQPLDAILSDLSKQAKCEVVLGGLGLRALASKKVSVSTGGKVPFWEAVLKVCDAADVQIAGVAGFYAPGAMPLPRGQSQAGVRAAADETRAVVLESRGDAKRRPASIHGAVLVEAVSTPKNATVDQSIAILQVWPEPRLQWEGTSGLRVAKAIDADGTRLAAEYVPVHPGEMLNLRADGLTLVRNADGSATWVRDTGATFQLPGGFKPNPRQAVVRFKAGEKAATAAKELDLALFGTVRSPIEPLSVVKGFEPNQAVTSAGNAGVDLSVTCGPDGNGKLIASVTVSYDPKAVHPVGSADDLPGVKGSLGNYSVYGVRITDSDGKPYTLGLSSGASQFDLTGKRFIMKMQLELHPNKDGQGAPSAVTFWGNCARPIEVPVRLKDVMLSAGK